MVGTKSTLDTFTLLSGPHGNRLVHVVDLGDGGVGDGRRGTGLPQEAAAPVRIGGDFGMENQRTGVARGGVVHAYSSPS